MQISQHELKKTSLRHHNTEGMKELGVKHSRGHIPLDVGNREENPDVHLANLPGLTCHENDGERGRTIGYSRLVVLFTNADHN